MLLIIQSYSSELAIILCHKYLRIRFCLQQILKYLKFYEATTQVVHRRAKACVNVFQHFIQVETYRQLDKLILFMAEYQTVAFILDLLCHVFSIIHIELELTQ